MSAWKMAVVIMLTCRLACKSGDLYTDETARVRWTILNISYSFEVVSVQGNISLFSLLRASCLLAVFSWRCLSSQRLLYFLLETTFQRALDLVKYSRMLLVAIPKAKRFWLQWMSQQLWWGCTASMPNKISMLEEIPRGLIHSIVTSGKVSVCNLISNSQFNIRST